MKTVTSILDRLQDSFEPPLTRADLEILEEDLNVRLPEDYAQFLLQFNGGYFHHRVEFSVREPSQFVTKAHLSGLHGIHDSRDDEYAYGSDLREDLDMFKGRIPRRMLPIGNAWGDIVIMSLSGRDRGSVYLWDRVEEMEGKAKAYIVAESFDEFLQCLKPNDELEEWYETIPIFKIVERGNESATREYLENGGKVDVRNERGETLLMCAARSTWPKIVGLLLKHRASVTTNDSAGLTPLYHAVRGRSNDSVRLLLSAGADVNAKDREGISVLSFAADAAFSQVANTLSKHGAIP